MTAGCPGLTPPAEADPSESGDHRPGDALDRFLHRVDRLGLRLYPAQERAVLEFLAGRHVFLGTPTGSGKSLVAEFVHCLALCTGRRSFYTSPTKALASEKFFALCHTFGAQNVGMLTGDAAINRDAPIICCTAEILANLAIREGTPGAPEFVVMDEFHYYSDRQRGVAWQVPLIALPRSQFLMMSATMGDVSEIAARLAERTDREVADITGSERPVPLDYTYRETPVQTTVQWLLKEDRLPAYIVHFTHRECAETAQALTSVRLITGPERGRLAAALAGVELDTPYGRELSRLLRSGIGVHHAGMLPKYRLLVEQLAQQGRLKIVCGTDTLGVGVNIPIRTVLFARLAKYDGHRMRLLPARDFHQISGRAGRKGFDDRGSVVCQAPEHVIAARRRTPARGSRPRRRVTAPAGKGKVVWNRHTFEQLVERPPERLTSSFRMTHGMIVNALHRGPTTASAPVGYGVIVDLVMRCHEPSRSRHQLLAEAAQLFRSLRRAGLVELLRGEGDEHPRVAVSPELQDDFSLHETLSLYLVDAVAALDHEAAGFALDVVSLAEAIQESPQPILAAQTRRARSDLLVRLKHAGVPYEERRAALEQVTYPQPLADYIEVTFDAFASRHPWVDRGDIGPKSIVREILESGMTFNDYVRRYDLQRSEGLLLRHLNQVYKALDQTVPRYDKTEALLEEIYALRSLVARVDASLAAEWRRLVGGDDGAAKDRGPLPVVGDTEVDVGLAARIRAEMRGLVHALQDRDYDEAARWVRPDPDDVWDSARFRRVMEAFHKARGELVSPVVERSGSQTRLRRTGPGTWLVRHVLPDSHGRRDWAILGQVEIGDGPEPIGPVVRIRDIGR